MASQTPSSQIPSLSFNPGRWRELEVPGEIIDQNWSTDISGDLKTRADSPSISRDAILLARKQIEDDLDDDAGRPRGKEDLVEQIEDADEEPLKCLYAAFVFTRSVSEKYISYYFEQIETAVDDEYEKLYGKLASDNRRVGKALLLYIYDYESLQSIFALDLIERRKPREIGQAESPPSNPIDDLDVDKLKTTLESNSRRSVEWHDFEYAGDRYLVIKRHYRDGVDPQVDENEEIEEAEYTIAKFHSDLVDIHTQKKSTANSIRNTLSGAYDGQDVTFDRAEERKPRDHFQDTDLQDLLNDIEAKSGYTVTGLLVENTPLTNSPSFRLRTEEESINPALEDLQGFRDSFSNEMRDVSQIVLDKEETTYTLYPNQDEQGQYEWYVRYHADGVEDSERAEFEDDMEDVFDIEPTFISSN